MASQFKEGSLRNGLKVLTCSDESLPSTRVVLVSRAGSRYETKDQRGYAHFLEHMLLKGTQRFPSPGLLAKEIDKKGGYKNGVTNLESIRFILEAASEHTDFMFDLLSDMIFNSKFDPLVLENEKKVILEEFKATESNPIRSLTRFADGIIFKGHPLSQHPLGTEDSVRSANAEALRVYKEKHLLPGCSALIVAGNNQHKGILALADKYFGDWNGVAAEIQKQDVPPITEKLFYQQKHIPQTYVAYNFYAEGAADSSQEEAALKVVRNFLGYGSSSLLSEELRHKLGLVYMANASLFTFTDTAVFCINAATSNPEATIFSIKKLLANLKEYFTVEILEQTKTQLIGSFARNMITPGDKVSIMQGGFLRHNTLYTPDDFISEIRAVSLDNILGVIEKYFDPEKGIVVAMGPTPFNI